MSKHQFLSVMVVGDNPEELMEKYKISVDNEPILKYRFKDEEAIFQKMLVSMDTLIKTPSLTKEQKQFFQERVNVLKSMSSEEYFQMITEGCTYDEEGNAYTTENINGKWDSYQKGNHFSVPLIKFDGTKSMSELNRNINWNVMHKADTSIYELVWEMVKEGKKPTNEQEQKMYDNMINRTQYMDSFKTKEEYVIHNSYYWNYAYLDENGWVDLDDSTNQFEWIKNFYDRFVLSLNGNERVTIFEYTVPID